MHVAGRPSAGAAGAAAGAGLAPVPDAAVLKSSSSSNSSPTSPPPAGLPQLTAPHRPPPPAGRRRTNDGAGDGAGPTDQQSPDSADGFEDREEGRIGVKRACNECRQQKVSHDASLETFSLARRAASRLWLLPLNRTVAPAAAAWFCEKIFIVRCLSTFLRSRSGGGKACRTSGRRSSAGVSRAADCVLRSSGSVYRIVLRSSGFVPLAFFRSCLLCSGPRALSLLQRPFGSVLVAVSIFQCASGIVPEVPCIQETRD